MAEEDVGDLPLAKAAELGDLAALQAELKKDGVDVNHKNKMGQTALHKGAPGSDGEVPNSMMIDTHDVRVCVGARISCAHPQRMKDLSLSSALSRVSVLCGACVRAAVCPFRSGRPSSRRART